MPRTLTLNAVRALRPVTFSAPDAQGNSTASLQYCVCNHSTTTTTDPVTKVVTTTDVYQDAPQSALAGTVTVAVAPSDTTLVVMGKLQAAALTAEGMSTADGDKLFL